jgi:transcriptional regulator with XRE-family HTH domain
LTPLVDAAPRLPTAEKTGADPTVVTARPAVKLSTKSSTLERRERARRAAERKTANGAAKDIAADGMEFRKQFREAARARGLSYQEIGRQLGAKHTTLGTWLSRKTPPAERSLSRLKRWLREPPAAAPDAKPGPPPPSHELTGIERDQLSGWLSIDERDARNSCGLSREILDKASAGERLPPAVIERVRGALANGADAS